jgi:hypothetical protein
VGGCVARGLLCGSKAQWGQQGELQYEIKICYLESYQKKMPKHRVRKQQSHRKKRSRAAFNKWRTKKAKPWIRGGGFFDDLLGVAAMFDPTGLVRTGVIAKTALGLGRKKRKGQRRVVRRVRHRKLNKKTTKGGSFLGMDFLPSPSEFMQSIGL